MDEKQKKILLIGGALLIGAFLLSQRQSLMGDGVGTAMQPTFLVTPPPTTIDAPSYPVIYNIPAFPEPPEIPKSSYELAPPETFFAPSSPTKKDAFALPPAVYVPPEEMTPGFVATVEETAKKKEEIPPQFRWR